MANIVNVPPHTLLSIINGELTTVNSQEDIIILFNFTGFFLYYNDDCLGVICDGALYGPAEIKYELTEINPKYTIKLLKKEKYTK